MIPKVLPAITICLLCCFTAISQKHTISGYVFDKKTGERLRGASVLVAVKTVGTTTNNFGFYSLTLPADSITLLISYAGFALFERKVLKGDLESAQTRENWELMWQLVLHNDLGFRWVLADLTLLFSLRKMNLKEISQAVSLA